MTARRLAQCSPPPVRSIANVALRISAAGGKFALLLVLARTTDAAAVGLYGLVAATITLGLYVVGVDYYTYTTRQLLRAIGPSPGQVIRDQASLQGRTYLLSMVPVVVLFATGLLPWRVAPWFLGILITEHVSLEFYRLLIARKRPLRANAVFFLRTGSWSFGWSGLALVWPSARSLDALWIAWVLGGVLAIAVGTMWMRDVIIAAVTARPDWERIRRGLRVAWQFLVATLAFRAMLTIDRYVLEAFRGTAEVGIYTLYIGMANVVVLIVQSGVVVVLFPRLVEGRDRGDDVAFRHQLSRFTRIVGASAIAAGMLVGAAVIPLLTMLGNPSYRADLASFWVLLVGTTVAALNFIPHYVLYALDKDREIMMMTLLALVVAVAGDLLLVPVFGLAGAAIATLFGFVCLAGGKTVAVRLALGERISE